jgi:hypothetical protein
MQIYNIAFQLLLCMSLLVPVANAENLSVPDKEHRQGMSYEEYSNYREKMRLPPILYLSVLQGPVF